MSISSAKIAMIAPAGAGSADVDYYFTQSYGAATGYGVEHIVSDSEHNLIVSYPDRSSNRTVLSKFQPDGTLIWERELKQNYFGFYQLEKLKVVVDSNDDLICCFAVDQAGGSPVIIKINGSNGTTAAGPTWVNGQSGSSYNPESQPAQAPIIKSNGQIIFPCSTQYHIFNSNLSFSSGGYRYNGVRFLGFEGNTVAVWGEDISTNAFRIARVSLSNNSEISEKTYTHNMGYSMTPEIMDQNSSGDIALVFSEYPNMAVAKVSSGFSSVSWMKRIPNIFSPVCVMSESGDIIVVGRSDYSTYTQSLDRSAQILSFDSSGNINFHHSFGATGSNYRRVDSNSRPLVEDVNGNIMIGLVGDGVGNKGAWIKIPSSGATTQTLTNAQTGYGDDVKYQTGISTVGVTSASSVTVANSSSLTLQSESFSTTSYGSISNASLTLTHTQATLST